MEKLKTPFENSMVTADGTLAIEIEWEKYVTTEEINEIWEIDGILEFAN